MFDGLPGEAPEVEIISKEGKEKRLKINGRGLDAGDRVIVKTGGGGGFGNPQQRQEKKIRNDVLDGLIDESFAKENYNYKK